jgi:hypothetical protein
LRALTVDQIRIPVILDERAGKKFQKKSASIRVISGYKSFLS